MSILPKAGFIQASKSDLKTTENCVCILKMECRIRDKLEAKINKGYAKTLLTSLFNSIHVRQPLNFTDWDPFLWPALR